MKEGKTVYLIYPGFLKRITVVMFTNAFHYYCMHIAPTACKIHFPGVPNYFDQIGIWQGSPKVIKVGKSVFSIHYWCLWMSSVVTFTIIFTYYLLDIHHNTWSIQFMGVSIFLYLKCICQGSPNYLNGQKKAYFTSHGCLKVCVVFELTR